MGHLRFRSQRQPYEASVLMLGTITSKYAVTVSVRQSVAEVPLVVAVTVGSLWRAAQIAVDLHRLARACACVNYKQLPAGVT
ncbi:hypothetical protein [Micromonospora sp. NBC_01638]|uniref:hypothetical protein n=1 Tax=Micromonospora sp. NBC_01638 TaxID=2975982 RepID=UPI00386EE672|nr:hypothetical protein OG811_20265 [Micromonospora sp. NBC_01638]